jgi:WD40 repeat protein
VAPSTLVSTHGFTEHHVAIWDMKLMFFGGEQHQQQAPPINQGQEMHEPTHCFQGHTARVLYAARSPCQRMVCTGAGDGSVRLWECFQETPKALMRRRLESLYL